MRGLNGKAAAKVVESMHDMGRLEVIDEARVQAFLSLAAAVDAVPHDASLWRQYRAAEQEIRLAGAEVDDALSGLYAALRDADNSRS